MYEVTIDKETGLPVMDNSFARVVRCKDCIHYWKNNPSDDDLVCLASPKDDAFCSEGERRESECHARIDERDLRWAIDTEAKYCLNCGCKMDKVTEDDADA